jgi:crotonobetainyl-CoA:carnitine CoA-transferase CaiB-like acyl-CoA transferase
MVIKVEPIEGDPLRRRPPIKTEGESLTFQTLATNKMSIAVNFGTVEADELLRNLLKKTDVLIENIYNPPDRWLNMTYHKMAELNPRLVYCVFSPFGCKGELKDYVGNDLVVQAMSGVVATTGHPNTLPNKTGPPFASHTCALMGGIGIMAALNFRESTGLGQEIDMAVYDSMVSYLYTFLPGYFISGKAPKRLGNQHPMSAPWDTYKAKDGWVIVCMGDDRQWHNFLYLIGRPEIIENPRYKTNDERIKPEIRPEVEKMVADWVEDKTVSEVMKILDEIKIPAGPIYTIEQSLKDEQFLSRDMVVEMEHPVSGIYHTFGSIFKMSATPGRVNCPSPLLGQHGRMLLKELCGYDEKRISALEKKGILLVKEG